MKKLLSVFLCAMMGVACLSGCNNGAPSAGGQTSAANSAETASSVVSQAVSAAGNTSNAKIGFLAPTLQTEFFITIDNGLKKECENKGWKYTSVSFNNDSATAVTGIENMVTSKCSVIIAMVSDSSCDDALKQAQKAGVKVLECGVQTKVYDVCLGTDQYGIGKDIGKMASEWVNKQLGGKANIVVYTTNQNTDMKNRGQGIQDALKQYSPNSKILEVVDIGKDVVGSGTSTTENMLQKHPDLNVICSYGDAAAVESAEAVKAAGKAGDNFGIFSCDGTEAALKSIANKGVLRGTVRFDPLAPQMVGYCEQLLSGKTFSDVVLSKCESVTDSNISQYYTAK
jgi:ABC-type sugar transport system, periplasmic component